MISTDAVCVKGDVLQIKEGIIVHGCNAQGVMGSGIAAQVKQRFPQAYGIYLEGFKNGVRGKEHLGKLSWIGVGPLKFIVNAITQEKYGRDPGVVYVDYDAIRACFRQVAILARTFNVAVHYPKIGCGLANGDLKTVVDIIDSELEGIRHYLWFLEDDQDIKKMDVPYFIKGDKDATY